MDILQVLPQKVETHFPTIGIIDDFADLAREKVPDLPLADRHKVALGFDP